MWQKIKPVTEFFFGLFDWLVGWLACKQHLVMADARLQVELTEMKAEVLRLRESISVATPAVTRTYHLSH